MTKIQEILGKILTSRIKRENVAGILETNKEKLTETLDIFLAGDKITAEQYGEFSEMITSTTAEANVS
jgi:hypothetical protein